jgi:hypothetical protein
MTNDVERVPGGRKRYGIRSEDGVVHTRIPDLLDVNTRQSIALCRALCSPKRVDAETDCMACIAAASKS